MTTSTTTTTITKTTTRASSTITSTTTKTLTGSRFYNFGMRQTGALSDYAAENISYNIFRTQFPFKTSFIRYVSN